MPRRGDPRRDVALRLRLGESAASGIAPGLARHRRALLVRSAHRREHGAGAARVVGGKRHQGEDAARAVMRWPLCAVEARAVGRQSAQRHPDATERGHAARDRVRRGGRRAARARPDGQRAAGAGGGAARARGGAVPAVGDDVQPDRDPAAHAAGRRGDPRALLPPDHRRGGRPGRALRRDDAADRRRRRDVHRRAGRGVAAHAGEPLRAALAARCASSRRRTTAAAGCGRSSRCAMCCDGAGATASPPTSTARA